MDAQRWSTSYRDRVRDVLARAERAHRALAGCEATASSPDGAVTVTATPSGQLRGLVLAERADALPRAELAAAVLATAGDAQQRAVRRATEAIEPLLGADGVRALHARLGAGSP